jgi:cobalt-zinc-cadmium efflux system protein
VAEVHSALCAVPGVAEIHDLHVWAINDRTPSVSAHLVVHPGASRAGCGDSSVLDRAAGVLRERFGLAHSTLQVEHGTHSHHEDTCR